MSDVNTNVSVTGFARKLRTKNADTVQYEFIFDNDEYVELNSALGHRVRIEYTAKNKCISCDRAIKKVYQQGYCYPCTQRLAACDMCILKPEKCHYHLGTCREPQWGEQHCMQSHIVYLANSSGLKVGITKEVNVPYRWLDQGAIAALPILKVTTRYQSGLIEDVIKQHMSDKTNWRKMLQGDVAEIDLSAKRDQLLPEIATEVQSIAAKFPLGDIEILTNEEVQRFVYPVLKYPTKVKSYNLLKDPIIDDELEGIKGQYLIFKHGVINVRNMVGMEIILTID